LGNPELFYTTATTLAAAKGTAAASNNPATCTGGTTCHRAGWNTAFPSPAAMARSDSQPAA